MTSLRQIKLTEDDASPFVDGYLLYLLAATSHALSSKFHLQVKAQGVKVQNWRVLACLIDRPGLMLTELAQFVLLEQSHLTKIIDQLQADGLVEKHLDTADRRKIQIYITDRGRELVEPLIAAAKTHEQQATAILSRDEEKSLKTILHKLIREQRETGNHSLEEEATRPALTAPSVKRKPGHGS
ncbi:MarR family winged helix-turn-helix transcriptional regulator [Pelagibius sp. Alg239-R121]|uniref:MarR family winged helix-turn-helix transcriptional regulator n=1 Tax=Pelagibius sp. Alg239-R121 TaxID=2993448 RepID=UPI0024A71091|nr:MarR family transcriptional regulator [Pelagibius sp. Alg239-R121]